MEQNRLKTIVVERTQSIIKKIRLIEWDLPNIKNSDMRKKKEEELMKLREDLAKISSIRRG